MIKPESFLRNIECDGDNSDGDLKQAKGTIGNDHDTLTAGCISPRHLCVKGTKR